MGTFVLIAFWISVFFFLSSVIFQTMIFEYLDGFIRTFHRSSLMNLCVGSEIFQRGDGVYIFSVLFLVNAIYKKGLLEKKLTLICEAAVILVCR